VSGSYRSINYSLRPAKAIERKMLCEAFWRLYPFGKVEDYRYVGFGSIYFTDFNLFHRTLGISDMLSIERDAYAKECFEFNRPYECVRMDFRNSSDSLPTLDWSKRTIVWLDYDGKLDEEALADVGTVCTLGCSGSLLLVSVNAHVQSEPGEEDKKLYESETGKAFSLDEYRLREIRKLLGDSLPTEVTGSQLRGKGIAQLCRKLVEAKITEVLSVRNRFLPEEEKFTYQQLFNFHYSDGALMLTIGGILCEKRDLDKMARGFFETLAFVKTGAEPYVIQVPCLTLKEMRHLNSQLPRLGVEGLTVPGVPPSQIKSYAEVYRYFPTFTEALL